MPPRIEDTSVCRHCRAPLPEPVPRVCPHCAGSLQKRFLSCGCLSSAPPIVLLSLAAAWAVGREAEPRHEPRESPRESAAAAPAPQAPEEFDPNER